MSNRNPKPGSIEGDTVNCFHKRGGCGCLEKACEIVKRTGKPSYIRTATEKLKVQPK